MKRPSFDDIAAEVEKPSFDDIALGLEEEEKPQVPTQPRQPTYNERVQADADKLALGALESVKKEGGINAAISPVRQFTGTVAAQVNQTTPYRMIAKAASVKPEGGINQESDFRRKALDFISGKVAAGLGKLSEKSPEWVKNTAGIAGDVASLLPAGGTAVGAGRTGIKAIASAGEKTLDLGKVVKAGDLKIPVGVARKGYGKDLAEKKKNIVNDMQEFQIYGSHEDGAAKAMQMAEQRFDEVKNIAAQIDANPNIPLSIPSEVAARGIDFSALPYGLEDKARAIFDNIISSMETRGAGVPVNLSGLIEAKKRIDTKTTFNRGPAQSYDDALEDVIRKKMYLNLVDEISSKSPEIKQLNTEAKRLLDINAALTSAASREANKYAVGLSDFILGGASIANPGALAVTAPLLVVKKGLSGGRGSSALMQAGEGLGNIAKKAEDVRNAGIKKPAIQGADYRAVGSEGTGFSLYDRLGRGERKALPPPMIRNPEEFTMPQAPIPTKGQNMRNIGESGDPRFDKPIANFPALPSPDDIKKLYPHLSEESTRKVAFKFKQYEDMVKEKKYLPAPMVNTAPGASLDITPYTNPTKGQVMSKIGLIHKDFSKLTPEDKAVLDLIKRKQGGDISSWHKLGDIGYGD